MRTADTKASEDCNCRLIGSLRAVPVFLPDLRFEVLCQRHFPGGKVVHLAIKLQAAQVAV